MTWKIGHALCRLLDDTAIEYKEQKSYQGYRFYIIINLSSYRSIIRL